MGVVLWLVVLRLLRVVRLDAPRVVVVVVVGHGVCHQLVGGPGGLLMGRLRGHPGRRGEQLGAAPQQVVGHRGEAIQERGTPAQARTQLLLLLLLRRAGNTLVTNTVRAESNTGPRRRHPMNDSMTLPDTDEKRQAWHSPLHRLGQESTNFFNSRNPLLVSALRR